MNICKTLLNCGAALALASFALVSASCEKEESGNKISYINYTATTRVAPSQTTGYGRTFAGEIKYLESESTFAEGEGEMAFSGSPKKIPDNGFRAAALKSIVLPQSVESIDRFAFAESTLEEIVIPSGVKTLPYGLFDKAYSLKTVIFEFGSKLKTIDSFAFSHCHALEEITIPAGVTDIEYGAFCDCTGLKSIICLGTSPASLNDDGGWTVFAGVDTSQITVKVPALAVFTYKAADGWKDLNIVPID